MKNNINPTKTEITPVYLHLELKDDYLSDYEKRMLKRYGDSNTGDSITRDILIPSDMPLHNLHYAIQKLFGWQNSHLRSFYLPEQIYKERTGGMVRGWSDLVGILFQPPSEAEYDIFWDDDYERGSFKVWLRKKYTGPYIYRGMMEHPEIAKQDVQEFLEHFKMVEVREPLGEYINRQKKDKNTEIKIVKKAPIMDLTLEEMNLSIMIEGGTESLLERLEVDKVIAFQGEEIDSNDLFPVTKELIYNYDFGDNWIITIKKMKNYNALLKDNIVDEYEIKEAENIVRDEHKPVCINKEGVSVLDDVGGLSGFANFLGVIYEGKDKEEAPNARAWAKSLGWSDKRISNKMMI